MNPICFYGLSVLVGILTGTVAALCGVGGGIIMVPAFVWLFQLNQKQAVATSLAAIILTSAAASLKNHSGNLIDWRVTIPTGLAAGIVAWFAAGALKQFSNLTLTRVFGTVVILIGAWMLWTTFRPTPESPVASPRSQGAAAAPSAPAEPAARRAL